MRCFAIATLLVFATGCPEALEEVSCPDDGTELTYENFGRAFMADYCQSCHASGVDDRRGAPREYVFDTNEDVRAWADRIYVRSAGDNTSMPPGPEDPSAEEREALGEWLACGAP